MEINTFASGIAFDQTRDVVAVDTFNGAVAHRDLGAIAPTDYLDDGVAVINRTKNKTSPFVPIIKTPTFSENSGTHTGYAVEIEDATAPTGYASLGHVSKGYLLLPNADVRALARRVAERSGLAHTESRIFWDGARFAHIIDFHDVTEEVTEGDPIGLSLVTRTSYNKSWAFECALMGRRFVCDNGMLSGEFFARVRFKHTEKSERWEDLVEDGLSVIQGAGDGLARFVAGCRRLRRLAVDDSLLRAVRADVDRKSVV